MSKNLKTVGASLAIGAAALMATGCKNMVNTTSETVHGNVACYGINQCRGQGNCATANNACRGQNACAGQGLVTAESSVECEAKGGTIQTG